MKKIMLFLSLLCCLLGGVGAQVKDFTVKPVILNVSNGGGKTASSAVILKSNTEYKGYVNTAFTANQQPVHDVWVHDNSFSGQKGTFLFIGAVKSQPNGTNKNIKIDSNYLTGLSGQQYYIQLASTDSIEIVNNVGINSTGIGDGGFYYLQYCRAFNIHNNFFDRIHGKALRLWPGTGSLDTVYDNILLNMDQYSPIEIQEFYGTSDNWHVGFHNNTAGNLPVVAGNGTGLITLYYPAASQVNSTYSMTGNWVFNSSSGLLDNGSNTTVKPYTGQLTGPYAPNNTDWLTSNTYFPTMQAGGFASDSAVTLPDGRSWKTPSTVSPPPVVVNKSPIANAGGPVVDSLQNGITVTLDGSKSADPDGSIATYNWVQTSGNPVAIVSPSASKTLVTGISVGSYVFTLTVSDNKGASSAATVTVSGVLPAACPAVITPTAPGPWKITTSLINGTWVPAISIQ